MEKSPSLRLGTAKCPACSISAFRGCCGNATRKGEQRAARNPPFRYKNSGTRHFWQAPLGLIRILHPNHITGSIRCHLNPYQSVAARCCSLAFVLLRCWSFLFIARHYAPYETVLHRPSPCETICIDFSNFQFEFNSWQPKCKTHFYIWPYFMII